MKFSVHELADGQTILSGVVAGRRLFAQFVAQAIHSSANGVAFLDFAGIQVATGSFLRESVMAFRDYARSTLPDLYPVVANPTASVSEELEFVLKHRKDAMWTCSLDSDGQPTGASLIGELDSAHRLTFDMVAALGSATAPNLAQQGDAALGPTAWNNRLAFLTSRGLLRERRVGKTKTFTPVLESFDGN